MNTLYNININQSKSTTNIQKKNTLYAIKVC
jgi:hypothetical protein